MPTFKCWDVDSSDEDGALEIHSWGPEEAAKILARRLYQDDCPKEQTIAVRAPDGTRTRWTVTAEPDVRFTARAAEARSR